MGKESARVPLLLFVALEEQALRPAMRVSRAATRRLEGAICSLKNDSGLVQTVAHMSHAAAGAVLSEHGSLSMC